MFPYKKFLTEDQTIKQTTFNYFDGLGRNIQTVSQQVSPNKQDIVEGIEYDSLGLLKKEYLPVTIGNVNSGKYHIHLKDSLKKAILR